MSQPHFVEFWVIKFVLFMVYVYMNKMMVIMQFLLNLVMLENVGDEVDCDQMN